MQVTQALQEVEERTEALNARVAELQEEAARQESNRADLDAGSNRCSLAGNPAGRTCMQWGSGTLKAYI